MLRISMFSSSSDLRRGLHRAIALALRAGRSAAEASCWTLLPTSLRDAARANELDLVQIRELFLAPASRELLRGGAAALGCELPDDAAMQRGFADAILSSRALALQGGRDVYGASNKWIWDHLVAPILAAAERDFGAAVIEPLVADTAFEARVEAHLLSLAALDTSPRGEGHAACVAWLRERLSELGFHVDVLRGDGGERPIVVAHRDAHEATGGHIVLYGHYDVTPGGERGWSVPPNRVTERDGRWFGRGVADDKGPLACRLAALAELPRGPALTWLIQGEEEVGSPHARRRFPPLLADLRATLWLDETGYHDYEDGTLRLIARLVGDRPGEHLQPSDDTSLGRLLVGLRCLADAWGIGTRLEVRGLTKDLVAGGCPFNSCLPSGARYLALGVNDSRSRIHAADESIPRWPLALHRAELALLFEWASTLERGV